MRILLIHTGGTIGMAPGPDGLEPQKGLVEQAVLERLPQGSSLDSVVFDPLLDSYQCRPSALERDPAGHPRPSRLRCNCYAWHRHHGLYRRCAFPGTCRRKPEGSPVRLHAAAWTGRRCRRQSPSCPANAPTAGTRCSTGLRRQADAGCGPCETSQPSDGCLPSQPQATALPAARREFAPLNLAILTLSPRPSSSSDRGSAEHSGRSSTAHFRKRDRPDDAELIRVLERAVTKGENAFVL